MPHRLSTPSPHSSSPAPTGAGPSSPGGTLTSRPAAGRAPNGAGSVVARRRASDTVDDVFWSYRDQDGVSRRASARGFATVDTGRYVAPAQMTLAQYLTEWLEGARLKPATLGGYRRKIRLQVLPHLGGMALDQARPLHLNKLYRLLKARDGITGGPLSLSTVREVHDILSSACSDAVEAGLLADFPAHPPGGPTDGAGVHGPSPRDERVVGPPALGESH